MPIATQAKAEEPTPSTHSEAGEVDLLEDVLYVLDEFLGDTDPYISEDDTDDDIKQEEPIFWAHTKLIELREKLMKND